MMGQPEQFSPTVLGLTLAWPVLKEATGGPKSIQLGAEAERSKAVVSIPGGTLSLFLMN